MASAVLYCTSSADAKTDRIETAGTIVAVALPVAAGSITAAKHDWSGFAQLVAVTAATVGTVFTLKYVVHEERPDHSDNQSFPSDTSAVAFAPAQFLWDRYGWQYGAPAYLAAGFVGYSRVESRQHIFAKPCCGEDGLIGNNDLPKRDFMRCSASYSSERPAVTSAMTAEAA